MYKGSALGKRSNCTKRSCSGQCSGQHPHKVITVWPCLPRESPGLSVTFTLS